MWCWRSSSSTSPASCATGATAPATTTSSPSVDGREITVGQFRRVYQQQMQAYRAAYGGNVDEQLLKQLGIDQRIVQQMIEEEAALAEAARLGITASDEEVRERILALPAFQENGQFIGEQRYRQMLQMQNPPMTPDEFEEQVRRGITLEKLQARADRLDHRRATRTSTHEFKQPQREGQARGRVASPPTSSARTRPRPTPRSRSTSRQHKDELQDPREAQGAATRSSTRRRCATARRSSPQDIQRYYKDNQQQYSTPEQVRASHILLKTEGKDDAAVKKQAEDLLAKVEGGRGLRASSRRSISEDERSKVKGGDLDFFPQGPDGAGVRQGRVLDAAGRDQRSRQDAVRLPHHQGDRQEAGDDEDARRSAAADRGSAEVGAGAGRGAADRRRGRRRS